MIMSFSTAFAFERYSNEQVTIQPGDGTYKTPPTPLSLNIALADLNAYRQGRGLQPVTLNPKLIKASEVHAKDLAVHGIAAHEGTDGSTHSDRVQREGYYFTIAAENVATGQKSWDAVFQAWKERFVFRRLPCVD